MIRYFRRLYEYRDLMLTWISREVKVRYKQSVIGGLWAILQPLTLMVVFTVVFSLWAGVPTGDVPYPVFSYVGLLPWTFLATSIAFAVPSLVSNMNLVTRIYFPREILPVASVTAAFLDFLIASSLLFIMMFVFRMVPPFTIIWIPLLLFIQILLVLGIVLFMSALNVFYRDIRFVIPLFTQVWMYASPVIYPVSVVPPRFRTIYMLNPMAGLISSFRRVILQGEPPVFVHLATSAILSLLVFWGGYAYFKRSERVFADLI